MTFQCSFVIGLFVLRLICAQVANTDSRCGQQIVQACGKVTKFFGVGSLQQWRNGLSSDVDKGCDGDTSSVSSAAFANVSCTAAFPVDNQIATAIGWASLDDWCRDSLCSQLYSLGERPVVVCHSANFNPVDCCVEPGQLSPDKFRSTTTKCIIPSTSSTSSIISSTTRMSFQPPAEMTSKANEELPPSTVQTQNITPAPPSTSPVLVPAIVGSILGAAALIAILIVLWMRKKRRQGPISFDQRESFDESNDSRYSSISTQRQYHDTSDVRAPRH
jgi:hypothetical protein